MSSRETVIAVQGVSKCYEIYESPADRLKELVIPPLYRSTIGWIRSCINRPHPAPRFGREFWALRDVSFNLKAGESLGIIGRNGSGKSTLLQIIAGTLSPTSGDIEVKGRVAALLELGSGFNPEFTGRENVFLNGQILGLSRREIEDRFDEIAAFADIGDFMEQPVKSYSSGMFVRLAFAVQAHIDAAIIIIDEALAVGDVFFRQKCYQRLERLKASGAAILLVSHSMPDIEQYCERAILLDQGHLRFSGTASEAAKHYYLLHQSRELSSRHQDLSTEGTSDPVDVLATPTSMPTPISGLPEIGNGKARFLGLELLGESGKTQSSFRQGEKAIFRYAFEILESIGTPAPGVLIKSDRGVIVHGKNALQFEVDDNHPAHAGSRLIVTHEVYMDLGIGEYTFEVGLVAVAPHIWKDRANISFENLDAQVERICHVPDVGVFSVGFALQEGIPTLTHHGIANLKGHMQLHFSDLSR